MADKKQDSEGGAMRIDSSLVRELAELLTANELNEIEVEDGDRKIKVRRDPVPIIASHASHYAGPPPTASAAPVAATAPTMLEAPAEDFGGQPVKSPMVGTAFLAAEPGGTPFVKVGDSVKAGQTLLIVEAMKVMNPITAPAAGTVKNVMVADAQPVEFDQPLVILG